MNDVCLLKSTELTSLQIEEFDILFRELDLHLLVYELVKTLKINVVI